METVEGDLEVGKRNALGGHVDVRLPPADADAGATSNLDGGVTIATTLLSYDVIDADWNAVTSTLALLSKRPSNALHLVDPASGVDHALALPGRPRFVSIDPPGKHAVVVLEDAVVFVNLTTSTIAKTCAWAGTSYDVVLSSTDIAYIAPNIAGDNTLHVVDMSTCTATSAAYGLEPGMLAFDATERFLYSATENDSPSEILRFDLDDPALVPHLLDDGHPWTAPVGDGLWMGAEPNRIYTTAGSVLYAPNDPDAPDAEPYSIVGDIVAIGQAVRWVAEAPSVHRIAFLHYGLKWYDPTFGDPAADRTVYVDGAHGLEPIAQYPLESGHGAFLFSTADMSRIYVVTTSSAAYPDTASFAIETLAP